MSASFWERSNDIQNRGLHFRATRFIRAQVSRIATKAVLLAEDPRVRTAWARHWEQDHFIRLLRLAESGFQPRTIYDIGGHEGRWAEMAQSIFSPNKIYLFEPQADLHRQIEQRQRPSGAWQIVGKALGDQDESRTMHVTANEAASSLLAPVESGVPEAWRTNVVGSSSVEVRKLDSLVRELQLPTPDLVKIDVQGFEAKVIRGGRASLAQAQRIVVEVSLRNIYEGQAFVPEILGLANELGFDLEDMNDAVRDHAGKLWQADLWLKRRK